MTTLAEFKIRIFADGADLSTIAEACGNPAVAGFTTNPTLMRKAGVSDYRRFARQMLALVGTKPVSFEVFSDDFAEMERHALDIASWGDNVYVKIPITDTAGRFSGPLIARLVQAGVRVNVTAVLTPEQVAAVAHRPRGAGAS